MGTSQSLQGPHPRPSPHTCNPRTSVAGMPRERPLWRTVWQLLVELVVQRPQPLPGVGPGGMKTHVRAQTGSVCSQLCAPQPQAGDGPRARAKVGGGVHRQSGVHAHSGMLLTAHRRTPDRQSPVGIFTHIPLHESTQRVLSRTPLSRTPLSKTPLSRTPERSRPIYVRGSR